jgi:hypothetical protein
MKKVWALFLALMSFCCFVGCKNKGWIPDGKYAETPGSNVFTLHEADSRIEFYWEIDGVKAKYYVSAALMYKCNVVEKDGKIYFEGYTWKSPFSSHVSGREFTWEVVYDEAAKSITVLWE